MSLQQMTELIVVFTGEHLFLYDCEFLFRISSRVLNTAWGHGQLVALSDIH